jgi:hypothetical protein
VYQYIRDVWISGANPNMLSFFMSELEPGVGGSFNNRFFMERYVSIISATASNPIPAVDLNSWHISPVRTCYYSDFFGASDWQDNWQTMWLIQVDFSNALAPQLFLEEPGTVSLGDTEILAGSIRADANITDRNDAENCFIICKFPKHTPFNKLDAALNSVDFSPFQMALHLDPYTTQRITLKMYDQVQFNLGKLGPVFFRDGAAYAQRIIEICRAHGGIENCKTMSLPNEHSPRLTPRKTAPLPVEQDCRVENET